MQRPASLLMLAQLATIFGCSGTTCPQGTRSVCGTSGSCVCGVSCESPAHCPNGDACVLSGGAGACVDRGFAAQNGLSEISLSTSDGGSSDGGSNCVSSDLALSSLPPMVGSWAGTSTRVYSGNCGSGSNSAWPATFTFAATGSPSQVLMTHNDLWIGTNPTCPPLAFSVSGNTATLTMGTCAGSPTVTITNFSFTVLSDGTATFSGRTDANCTQQYSNGQLTRVLPDGGC